MSRLYPFIINQWLLGKDETYAESAYLKGYITEEEKQTFEHLKRRKEIRTSPRGNKRIII